MSEERTLMLGRKAQLEEEINTLAEKIKTQTKAIRQETYMFESIETLPVANIRVNAQTLEALHGQLLGKLKKLRAINKELDKVGDEPLL